MTLGSNGEAGTMVGASAAMNRLRENIEIAAGSGLSVLITGETGVGKELVALALHRASGRPGAFVPVNVCAPSESMFEDFMFGHVRGAFTGATSDRAGYFMEAHRGTLFLDEISALSSDAQAKLLRVVETQRFRPVGAKRDSASDFRLIAASNVEIDDLVERNLFRADFAFRVRGMELRVPPLRERPEDIPDLVMHFLRGTSSPAGSQEGFSPAAIQFLQTYDWPGNVRQLSQVVARAAAFARGAASLSTEHLRRSWSECSSPRLEREVGVRQEASHNLPRRRLLDLLDACDWNTATVASRLRVSRKTVYARMHRLGIPVHRVYRTSGEFTSESGETDIRTRDTREGSR